MNNARMEELERGLNGMAKKVLAAVPMQDDWGAAQISAELARNGSNPDMRVITGCLSTLKDSGLVQEPKPGRFTRRPRKPEVARVVSVSKAAEAPPEAEKALANLIPMADGANTVGQAIKGEMTALEKIDRMGSLLRQYGSGILAIADALDAVALEFEERIEEAGNKASKLKQLQDLLREIGADGT